MVIHGRRIDRAGDERISRNQISTTLFGHAEEAFFPRLAVDIGEGGLVVLISIFLIDDPKELPSRIGIGDIVWSSLGELMQNLFGRLSLDLSKQDLQVSIGTNATEMDADTMQSPLGRNSGMAS